MAFPLEQQEPDAYCIAYYPMGHPLREGLTDSSLLFYIKENTLLQIPNVLAAADNLKYRIVMWIKNCIPVSGSVVITTVPRSTAGQLHGFLLEFCLVAIHGLANAMYYPLLRRTETVAKSSLGGSRDQETHEETIQVSLPNQDITAAVILVLDDIWTTGSTMRACRKKLKLALGEFANIRLLAIGRTTN